MKRIIDIIAIIAILLFALLYLAVAFFCLFSEGDDGSLTIFNFLGLGMLILAAYIFKRVYCD